MHPRLEAMPPRFRDIVMEEIEAAPLWLGVEVTLDQLFLPSRGHMAGNAVGNNRKVSKVRNAIWFRLRDEGVINGAPVSTTKMGLWFGRDHTSISTGIKSHDKHLVEWAAGKQKLYVWKRVAYNNAQAEDGSITTAAPRKAA